MHGSNIIYRDVRFANIFLLPKDDDVLLNDWGASTNGGTMELVQGCPEPFCHPELTGVAGAVPKPTQDLYSLVVSAAYLLLPGLLEQSHRRTLAEAFSAACRVDYDGVWQGFENAGVV